MTRQVRLFVKDHREWCRATARSPKGWQNLVALHYPADCQVQLPKGAKDYKSFIYSCGISMDDWITYERLMFCTTPELASVVAQIIIQEKLSQP